MLANELIASEISPLDGQFTGAEALHMMEEGMVRHLPLLINGEFQGILSEEDLLDRDPTMKICDYGPIARHLFVREYDHILEVLELVAWSNTTAIPVLSDKDGYLGTITLERLIHSFVAGSSFVEPGAIIVLEMDRVNYSLAEISRIVESENGLILSSYISEGKSDSPIFVTLKLNLQNIQFLVSAFERYGYVVKSSYTDTDYVDVLKDRYESLMHFLDI